METTRVRKSCTGAYDVDIWDAVNRHWRVIATNVLRLEDAERIAQARR